MFNTNKFFKAGLAVGLLLLAHAVVAQTVTFNSAIDLHTSSAPEACVIADFNEDTYPDIASAIYDGYINVFLSQGTSPVGFNGYTSFPVERIPRDIATGDFNNDGHLDLVTPNITTDNSVSVLLGDGNGGFAHDTTIDMANYPVAVVTGDFNADTYLDILVAGNASPSGIILFTGNGQGRFTNAIANTSPGTGNPQDIAVGYFNTDVYPDIAVAGSASNKIGVMLGSSSGVFTNGVSYYVVDQPNGIVCGDVNEDGFMDLVTDNTTTTYYSVLLGVGDGTFQPAVNVNVNKLAGRPALQDFNNDGDLDLALLTGDDITAFDSVFVYLGDGAGTFTYNSKFKVETNAIRIESGDFNKDGWKDLAVVSFGGVISVLINNQGNVATGVSDATVADQLNVFPNPASDIITIEAPLDKVLNVSIKTIEGKELYADENLRNGASLYMEGLPKGIYLLYLKSEEAVAIKRIIKH